MSESRATRARPASAGVIEIFGAREHNLNVPHLVLPKNALVVFTGPSGSGKSSLAFDTLYAEGQRRYVESLSAYARQFLGRLERPAVEKLRGLSPTIAIEQKSASGNPRSTVGTITEIYDYLRVLYARAGVQHCHTCGKPVAGQSVDEIVREVLALPTGTRAVIAAPLVRHRKGEFKQIFTELRERGFARVRIDGALHALDALPDIDRKTKHDIDLVIDRIKIGPNERQRLAEAVELALREGGGELEVSPEGQDTIRFSESRRCCQVAFPELSPQSFSFNSPLGMCPACHGLGTRLEVDPDLVIPNPDLSIQAGAIAPWATSVERGEGWTYRIIEAMAKEIGVDLQKPWRKIPDKLRQRILYGISDKKIRVQWGSKGSDSHGSFGVRFEGIIPTLKRRFHEAKSDRAREHYAKYLAQRPCDVCGGKRLRPESLAVRVSGNNLGDVVSMPVRDARAHFEKLTLSKHQAQIAEGALREIKSRLDFLLNVGLEYLTLERSGPTLSGGEAQRIRLASQLGSELSGVLYVLDEPSIGLHARDNERLVRTLEGLRDLGNSVLVVEHDADTIRAADHVVDFGPGAGHQGGKVMFSGTPEALLRARGSLTGDYLSGRKRIEPRPERRKPRGALRLNGARENNLKNIDVALPLGCLVAITGVSGAGKSSLVGRILLPALARALHKATDPVGQHDNIEGLEAIDKVIAIDQQPIGRTPRSNPGTYTKAFDEIRNLYAELPDARTRGFSAARFSFNVKGGRCEACQGDGVVKVEMHFLSDVYVHCEVCGGKRYNDATLEVRYKGRNIAEILETSVAECLELFGAHPLLSRILRTLTDVGLGYMKIGQPAPTLSGGEAQRIKLARELSKVHTGRTLYVLDEPTTGLHFGDTAQLLNVLHRLVDAENTVLVIEHNLDVIACADHIIDLGPEGGAAGGYLIAEGTPEQVAAEANSHTGRCLRSILAPAVGSRRVRSSRG